MKVWTCKILVNDDLPDGFDAPPREAVISAINNAGIDVVRCWSGWGGKLEDDEIEHLKFIPDYPLDK